MHIQTERDETKLIMKYMDEVARPFQAEHRPARVLYVNFQVFASVSSAIDCLCSKFRTLPKENATLLPPREGLDKFQFSVRDILKEVQYEMKKGRFYDMLFLSHEGDVDGVSSAVRALEPRTKVIVYHPSFKTGEAEALRERGLNVLTYDDIDFSVKLDHAIEKALGPDGIMRLRLYQLALPTNGLEIYGNSQ
jgi:hypothetical protein